ncbi:MAG: GDSL-type esterase/lipase family protein [Anaerovoracaceae bacterium]
MKKKLLITIGTIAAILLVSFGVFQIDRINENKDILNNKDELYAMASQDVSVLERQISKFDNENEKTTAAKNFKKIFKGAVVVGDSITESIDEYGFLDPEQTIYARGASVKSRTNIRSRLYSMKPKVAFLTFGMNDLEIYGKNTSGFIKDYKSFIKEIKKKTPRTKIYINSVMPATKAKIKKVPKLKYYTDYNVQLKKMCRELSIPFIDNTEFALSSNLFEPDGQHFKAKFYPKWLNRMAAAAGLIK